jgi:hypothetical protein
MRPFMFSGHLNRVAVNIGSPNSLIRNNARAQLSVGNVCNRLVDGDYPIRLCVWVRRVTVLADYVSSCKFQWNSVLNLVVYSCTCASNL